MANEPNRSRIENLLLRILGENVDLEEPLSRIEDLLYQVADIIVTLDSDGLIPINEIPPAAIEHMVTVANDTARFALTTDDVENGDTVYVDATKVMYMVIDDTHLDSETGYKEYSAGIATKAIADQLGNVINTYYQRLIDSSNKLNADLVDDTNSTNKFTNATEKQTWNGKQDALTFDSAPTENSTNPVTSGGVYTALSGKQSTIDSAHKLSADNVDDSNTTNKFATAAQLSQIGTNTNDISTLQGKTVGMDEGGSNYISVNDHKIFVDSNTPTGANTGDLWFGV